MNRSKAALIALSSVGAFSLALLSFPLLSSPAAPSALEASKQSKSITLTGEDPIGDDDVNQYHYVTENRDGYTHDRIKVDVISVGGVYAGYPFLSGVYMFGYKNGEDYFFRLANVPAYAADITDYDCLVIGVNGITSFSLSINSELACLLEVTLWDEKGPIDDGYIGSAYSGDISSGDHVIDYSYSGDGVVRYIKILPWNESGSGTFAFTVSSLTLTWSC